MDISGPAPEDREEREGETKKKKFTENFSLKIFPCLAQLLKCRKEIKVRDAYLGVIRHCMKRGKRNRARMMSWEIPTFKGEKKEALNKDLENLDSYLCEYLTEGYSRPKKQPVQSP